MSESDRYRKLQSEIDEKRDEFLKVNDEFMDILKLYVKQMKASDEAFDRARKFQVGTMAGDLWRQRLSTRRELEFTRYNMEMVVYGKRMKAWDEFVQACQMPFEQFGDNFVQQALMPPENKLRFSLPSETDLNSTPKPGRKSTFSQKTPHAAAKMASARTKSPSSQVTRKSLFQPAEPAAQVDDVINIDDYTDSSDAIPPERQQNNPWLMFDENEDYDLNSYDPNQPISSAMAKAIEEQKRKQQARQQPANVQPDANLMKFFEEFSLTNPDMADIFEMVPGDGVGIAPNMNTTTTQQVDMEIITIRDTDDEDSEPLIQIKSPSQRKSKLSRSPKTPLPTPNLSHLPKPLTPKQATPKTSRLPKPSFGSSRRSMGASAPPASPRSPSAPPQTPSSPRKSTPRRQLRPPTSSPTTQSHLGTPRKTPSHKVSPRTLSFSPSTSKSKHQQSPVSASEGIEQIKQIVDSIQRKAQKPVAEHVQSKCTEILNSFFSEIENRQLKSIDCNSIMKAKSNRSIILLRELKKSLEAYNEQLKKELKVKN